MVRQIAIMPEYNKRPNPRELPAPPGVDPREIAKVVANLLLSDNHRHIGCTHTINNGHDNHTAEGVPSARQ